MFINEAQADMVVDPSLFDKDKPRFDALEIVGIIALLGILFFLFKKFRK